MGYADMKVKSNSLFLKVDAGAPRDIRLLEAEPTEILEHIVRNGGQIKSFECPGDSCSYCQEGGHEAPAQRFITNVWDHGAQRVFLFKFGAAIAKQIRAIAQSLEEEKQDILAVDLKIEANGSGMTKKYSVTPRMSARPVPAGMKLHPKKKDDIPF